VELAVSDTYTVFAYDLNTNTKLTELPAGNLTFDSRLNDAGACSYQLSLDDPSVAKAAAPVVSLNGAPFALYIDRDGTIVWGGIAWNSIYTSSTRQLAVGANEFLSYFDYRVIAADYSIAQYPSPGIDPAQLLFKALTDAQSVALCGPGSSMGIAVTGGASSVPKIVPGYSQSQYTTVAQVISDVTSATAPGTGGVDLVISCSWGSGGRGGTPTRAAAIASPRAGRSASQTGLIFDLSQAIDYTWPTDASQAGTRIFAVGSGAGQSQLVRKAVSPQPVGGLGQYPRLDLVVNATQVQSGSQLQVMANGLANMYGQAVASPTATLPTDYGPNGLGSWLVGDDARLITDADPNFPNGLDQFWRIVQHSVTVPDSGRAQVTLTFNRPPVF
jgi:hypothetical protein